MIGPPGPADPHAIADGRLTVLYWFAAFDIVARAIDDSIQQGVSPPYDALSRIKPQY